MTDPQQPARLACEMGAAYRLTCRYEWDRKHQDFRYRFYRHGRYIGDTRNWRKVVPMMDAYIGEPQNATGN